MFKIHVSCSRWNWAPFAAASIAVLSVAGSVLAGGIYVPNYSFASPDIGTNSPYAAPVLEAWQESAQPSWYSPSNFDNSPWSYLAGTFYNLPDFTNSSGTNATFIDNCVGDQAAFVQAIPQVAILQSLQATFNVGKTYTLTVGLIGGGGGMPDGSTFQLSLYYLDGTNMVTVAAATVTNTPANFPANTHFVDFQVQTQGVVATNAWAGQNIGIQLLATPDFDDPAGWGGYWDVGNVRLVEGILVSNYSFASPDIGTNSPYAAPVLEAWQETAQPSWYNPADFDNSPWSYLAGTFYNLPDFTNSSGTNAAYIYNCVGDQAAFLQAVPGVGIFQDIDATFNVGKAYTLTVGLIGGGGGMPDGSTFQLSLYYQDGTNMFTVAATTVTNTPANYPTDTYFVKSQLQTPAVQATDPWAGQDIGIELMATPDLEDPAGWGGYWDVGNVQLVETTPPGLTTPALTSGQFQFTVQSEPNVVFQILSTTNLNLPVTNWASLGIVTNATGLLYVNQTVTNGQWFYTAEPVP
jgi:hypothetical protein